MAGVLIRDKARACPRSVAAREPVRAVVEAYGAGLVALPAVPKDTKDRYIRYAPSFRTGGDVPSPGAARAYTAEIIADFLGWKQKGTGDPQRKVYAALDALRFIEEGILKERDFAGLHESPAGVGAEPEIRQFAGSTLRTFAY